MWKICQVFTSLSTEKSSRSHIFCKYQFIKFHLFIHLQPFTKFIIWKNIKLNQFFRSLEVVRTSSILALKIYKKQWQSDTLSVVVAYSLKDLIVKLLWYFRKNTGEGTLSYYKAAGKKSANLPKITSKVLIRSLEEEF